MRKRLPRSSLACSRYRRSRERAELPGGGQAVAVRSGGDAGAFRTVRRQAGCVRRARSGSGSGTRIEEGDRLRTDSTRRRRGGAERRLELENNRCRNAYEIIMEDEKTLYNNSLMLFVIFVSKVS